MDGSNITYHSGSSKSKKIASLYTLTHESPLRYLAYKNIPPLLNRFLKGKKSIDFGCGTGASSSFLNELGLNVRGVDVSSEMLNKARHTFPYLDFYSIDYLEKENNFDLVFSSFVLFELSSKREIINYLERACSIMSSSGIFVGITGSEHLYSPSRKWMTFSSKFPENSSLQSGCQARLLLKKPEIEFYDYYWTEADYLECFKNAQLEIIDVYPSIGSAEDPFPWEDELNFSPFITFVAKKHT